LLRRLDVRDDAGALIAAPEAITSRNHSLDLLRGLCAVAVAAFHYLSWSHQITVQSMGMFGVYTFFVLSAIAMMIRYSGDFGDAISLGDARHFYRNRVARIIPLLAAVAIFTMVFTGADWERTLLTATGAFALHMPGYLSTVTGAWSLVVEFAFYLVFPIACLFAMNTSRRTLIVVTLVLVVAQQVLIHQIQTPDDPEFWNRYTLPLTFAPFFAAGLIIFRCPPPAWRWNWVAGLCVLALMLGFSFLTPVNLYLGGPAFLALMVLSAVAVALLYRSRLPAVVVPIAQFLGAISYSMYLTHWIAILVAQRAPAPLAVPVFVVGTLAIACLATYGVERPARRWLTRGA
jgi:peptidoglycan/LPS O-acetylase OafA/YrhL